jgi:hypothetical protein
MQDSKLRVEAANFFDAFVSAFESFDGDEIARRYAAPYVSLHGDGSLECFETPVFISAYFQRVLDDYRQKGCRSCRFSNLDVAPLGHQCVLATVSWELLDEGEKVLSSWRESYCLRRINGVLEVFASVDHVE